MLRRDVFLLIQAEPALAALVALPRVPGKGQRLKTAVADVYEVCTVTVQDLEACAAAMAEDPCTGHEKAACTKVSRCGAPVSR